MSFRIAARTLLHLGAELISSDSTALYELVKNAFDASAKRVTIDINVSIPRSVITHLIEYASNDGVIDAENCMSIETLKQVVLDSIDHNNPNIKKFSQTIVETKEWSDLLQALIEANSIVISDSGEGMSLETLKDVYLTIGTRSRRILRETNSDDSKGRTYLGEKGIGRLSAMRLGTKLHIESTQAGEETWNILDIDWSIFSHDSDAFLDEFKVEPYIGTRKQDPTVSGTIIRISNLNSDWTKDKLKTLSIQELSKFTDPFRESSLFPIQLRFNQEPITIPRFNKVLFENAHAFVKAQFTGHGNQMKLSGIVRYRERERTFVLEGVHLISVSKGNFKKPGAIRTPSLINSYIPSESKEQIRVLNSLGPFELEIYWYNRRLLTALEGIGDRNTVLNIVKDWGGGVMVFRDGFRVMPYGGPRDDWLDLDRIALASGGYKVNRTQLIGRLNISNILNPKLTDQSNREGIRDSEEKFALITLLQYVIQAELRTFLDQTDKELKAREPVLIEELEKRVIQEDKQIQSNLAELVRRVPEIEKEKAVFNDLKNSTLRLREIMEEVQVIALEYERGRKQLLDLAGIGLTVEILAHELNRATEHALLTLADVKNLETTNSQAPIVRMLEVQLKTLQKRLQILDQLSTVGRQRKEKFDIINLVNETLESHKDQFEREHIVSILEIKSNQKSKQFLVNAVKGMVVQILENFIVNSVYWLRQQRELDPNHKSEIRVNIDTVTKELKVTDNGPGVRPDLKDRVFEAFVSTKPPGQGKGLGLFIAREIAKYHGEDVFLLEEATGPDKTYHSFVLTFGGMVS